MANDPRMIEIYPFDDGVELRLGSLRRALPDKVHNLYKDLLAVTLPEHEGYSIAVEDDTVAITPKGGEIKNPLEFAKIQMEVADLTERVATVFVEALQDGIFKAKLSAE